MSSSPSAADQKQQKKQVDSDEAAAADQTATTTTTTTSTTAIATTSNNNNNNNTSALLSVGEVYSVPIHGVDEDELPPPIATATATPQHPITIHPKTLKSAFSSTDSDGKFNSQLSLASMAVSAGGYSTDASTGSSSAAAVAAAAVAEPSAVQQEPVSSLGLGLGLPPLPTATSTTTATTMSKHTRQSSNIPKPPPIKKKQSSAYPPMIAAAEAPPSGEGSDRIRLGICAMDKKARSKPMAEILSRLDEQLFHVVFFGDDVIVNKPVEEWPCVDVLIAFYSKGYPLQKAKEYCALRKPFVLNDLQMQEQLKDRRRVYDLLEASGIDVPRHVFLSKDGYESTGKVVLLLLLFFDVFMRCVYTCN
jgi:hypothetical protein